MSVGEIGVVILVVWIVCLGLYVHIHYKRKQSDKPASLIPIGWAIAMIDGVAQDVGRSTFNVSDIELDSSSEEDTGYVYGEDMRLYMPVNPHMTYLGLADAKHTLDHQAEIAPKFRDKCLVFAGTILRGPGGGNYYMAFLYWKVDRWYCNFLTLVSGQRVQGGLVRCKPAA